VTLQIYLFAGVAVALLLALFWLLRRPASKSVQTELRGKVAIEDLFPLHCRHFPQIRQALSIRDEEFLRGRVSPQELKKWRAERRDVLRQFLLGLGEDFLRLDRLARTVAALSPEVSRARETERLWLSLRFRVLYRLVNIGLYTSRSSLSQLTRLTEMVGSFAAQIEAAIAALEKTSASKLRADFSA
jgi:hypothetical protein